MIISIDPGKTTGIAFKLTDGIYRTIEAETQEDVWGYIYGYPTALKTVVIEQFVTGGRISKYGLATVELVGGVKALCHHLGIGCVVHTPGMRMAFIHEAKALKVTQGPHELDALAHLLRYEHDNR